MTENALSKLSPIDDFKALKPKQWLAIVAGFLLAAVIVISGMVLEFCGLGYLLVAVILYMVPHMLGVSSAKIKSIVGVVFVVFLILFAAFACTGSIADKTMYSSSNKVLTDDNVTFEDGVITIKTTEELKFYEDSKQKTNFACEVTHVPFGQVIKFTTDKQPVNLNFHKIEGGYQSNPVDMRQGGYYYFNIVLDNDGKAGESYNRFINNGVSQNDAMMINLNGSAMAIALIGILFFMLLGLSAMMRKTAGKAREKMEAEGRMYPAGYDKCKNCGALVLPGEINCRKCGTPIEVPDEIKVLHKKDFFECSECGTEVPSDASFCPKCGARFDENTEAIIKHTDGTIDVSSDTFECSECGKVVPANAKRCPYCGAIFDEDDEEPAKKQN